MPFQKGNKHGKGRPTVLLPEVKRAIEENKNRVKVTILKELNVEEDGVPRIEKIIQQCIERIGNDGDAVKLKVLLELALGKMVDEPPEFPVTEEEKILILEYRRRKLEAHGTADPGPAELPE